MIECLEIIESEEKKMQFQEIYTRNFKKMFFVAKKIVGTRETAEDAVHDAFVKLAKNFERYAFLEEQNMEALCVTIVKNEAINQLRKQKNIARESVEELLLYRADERNNIEELIENGIVVKMMKTLPEVLKITMELKYVQEYSNREIADLLGVSKKTVEMRLYRGRKKIEDILQWSK